MLLDVAESVDEADGPDNPLQEVDRGYYGNEHQPEPHEQVDLLVKQIDRQHTLHRVLLHVTFKTCKSTPDYLLQNL